MTESIHGYGQKQFSFTARDVAAIGFRHKKVMVLCFIGVVLGVLASTIVLPTKYRAETKLLVKRERVDPVVSPEQNAPMTYHDTVSEEEINSEVELINSHDVLLQVVQQNGLDRKKWSSKFLHPFQTQAERTDKAVTDLRGELQLEVLKKTNVISIAYEAHDPKVAAKVLQSLDDTYLAKHLEIHHPSGQFQFFDQQAEQYRLKMEADEALLKQFSAEQGGVAPTVLRDMTLQKLADFNSQLSTTRASISETQTRIADLEKQLQTVPSRITTSVKKGDNAQVLENLKSTLITLENKRTELLTKYQPTYPLVQEVDKELSDTRVALAKEENSPVTEQVTDQNSTYSWVNSELAKAKADLAGFQARETALQSVIDSYNQKARLLEQQGIQQYDLNREEKEAEGNYQLYTKKKEEARIEDALDRTRLLNVAVVQSPSVPTIPTRSTFLFGLVAVLLASAVSVGVVFALDYADQSFRTPSEVLSELRIPVLAAVPVHADGSESEPITFDADNNETIIEERG